MSAQSDTVNQAISGSELIQRVWQGYVPPQYDYLPKAWDQKTRATMIVRDILQKAGVNDSGMSFNDDGSVKDANAKTVLDRIVDVSPYIIAGVGGAAALGAFGGAGSAAPEIGVTSADGLGFAPTTAAGITAASGSVAAPAAAASSVAPSLAGKFLSSDLGGAAISGVGSALTSYFGAKNRNDQAALDRQAAAERQQAAIASGESTLDPFRQQMSQGKDIGQLDRLERASYSPVRLSMPAGSPYARNMPRTSGGYSYEKSPELIASAGALKNDVMAGHGAPTMTNPANYGKTSAMDLLSLLAAKKKPAIGAFQPSYMGNGY